MGHRQIIKRPRLTGRCRGELRLELLHPEPARGGDVGPRRIQATVAQIHGGPEPGSRDGAPRRQCAADGQLPVRGHKSARVRRGEQHRRKEQPRRGAPRAGSHALATLRVLRRRTRKGGELGKTATRPPGDVQYQKLSNWTNICAWLLTRGPEAPLRYQKGLKKEHIGPESRRVYILSEAQYKLRQFVLVLGTPPPRHDARVV